MAVEHTENTISHLTKSTRALRNFSQHHLTLATVQNVCLGSETAERLLKNCLIPAGAVRTARTTASTELKIAVVDL